MPTERTAVRVKNNPFITIDLFVGAGGLTQGFKQAGFHSIFANDVDEWAIKTFAKNHPEAISSHDPIETICPKELRKKLGLKKCDLDVLLGGPPCQGFSTYGKRDPNDPRNKLYQNFLNFIKEFHPKVFVMENVVGILSLEGGKAIKHILADVAELGYNAKVFTLNAASYGTPQSRKRVFVVGGFNGYSVEMPSPTHSFTELLRNGKLAKQPSTQNQLGLFDKAFIDRLPPALTVKDAISDLPITALRPKETHESLQYPKGGKVTDYQIEMREGSKELTHHSSKQMLGIRKLRLALMRPGDYGNQIIKRLEKDGLPDDLIEDLLGGRGVRDYKGCRKQDIEKEEQLREILQKGHINISEVLSKLDSGGFANKYRRLEWDKPSHTVVAHMARDCSDFVHPEVDRFITVREAARLQSFPDTYYFEGSQFQQFKQIGNAVPPKLGEALGKEIKSVLNDFHSVKSAVNES